MKNKNNEGISYEASIRYLVEKSNKRAWGVAWAAILLAILMGGLIAYMLPLKKTEPYVVRVDQTTGMVDIITAVNKETMSPDEALDKFFTSTYVLKRESYYDNLISQDYVYVQKHSNNHVASEYRAIYEGENARDRLLANHEVKGKILSVVLGESAGAKTAQIRINLITKDLRNNNITNKITRVVTLNYDYSPETLTKEEERLSNPLGFKVTSYRVDNEVQS
jgi:type IV secretion system protein VirB8